MRDIYTSEAERHLSFLNHLQEIVIAINSEGDIVFNNAPEKSWFYTHAIACLHPEPNVRLLDYQLTPLSVEQLPLQRARSAAFQNLEFAVEGIDCTPHLWLSASGGPLPDGGAVISLRDISQRKRWDILRLRQKLYDTVTQLPNRSLLMDRVGFTLTRVQQRQPQLMALLLIGCRPHSGTVTGATPLPDPILSVLGQRLTDSIRPEDMVARVGADTFALLLEKIATCSAAIDIAERLQASLSAPVSLADSTIILDVTVGIALGPLGYPQPEDWLQDAALAMAQAQQTAEQGWWVSEHSLQIKHDQRLQIEMDLRRAIARDELQLHYQPIVKMQTQETVGFEALVRMQHPTRGVLSPNHFIPIAEETGLIVPLGWWILREACRQMQAWTLAVPAAADLRMSVNMSSKQFFQPSLLEKFQTILQETGFSPHRLTIEITEGVLIEHSDSIIETLQQLQAMGIRLSIDDFGTGYSSLSYLHRFPFNTLKIDRSFIENADQDFDKLEILQSVVRLAWNLGLDVVAEGVETQKHYAQLKALRCESGQGFLFAPPLQPQQAEDLIKQQFNGDSRKPALRDDRADAEDSQRN
jgi:diguanylate cyclase (GGDEF)-like protein